MPKPTESYVMVLPVPAYRIDATHFALEGAFVEHLYLLRNKLGALAEQMTLVMPGLSTERYEAVKASFVTVDETTSGVRFREAFPAYIGNLQYARHAPRVMSILREEIKHANVVHAGGSSLYQPFEFAALLIARALGKKTIFVTDIDQRETAWMNYKSGRWTFSQYCATKLLHDPHAHVQHLIAARAFSLVLLKGGDMAKTYGRGHEQVRDFLDSAYSEKHIISAERMREKVTRARNPQEPLRLIYAGRLTQYKGVDHMLRALRVAIDRKVAPIQLDILGNGEQRAELEALVAELGLGEHVTFVGHVPFGDQLFERLYDAHVLLAAPLSQDTPRSALDAMASGLAAISYDTYYYRDLNAVAGCVELVPWLDQGAFADAIVRLAVDRERLVERMEKSRAAAFENTQESWLERRVAWTRALFT